MHSIIDLQKSDSCAVVTFPMCALGAPAQKYTTFYCTPGLQPSLVSLADTTCAHKTHGQQVGGHLEADGWSSASHAAYPPDLKLMISKAIVANSASVSSVSTRAETLPSSAPPSTNAPLRTQPTASARLAHFFARRPTRHLFLGTRLRAICHDRMNIPGSRHTRRTGNTSVAVKVPTHFVAASR
eukprot:6210723-Pleurochrysis_carterae.AAC.3